MIKRKINSISFLLFLLLMIVRISSAQVVSPFNKRVVADTGLNYSFIVSGHFHGESTSQSTFPASTILAGIDTLNSLNATFLMSLGDLFIDVNETYIDHYQKSLFNKLKMPIFNAVGNHDLSNNNFYEKVYGKTFYSFSHNRELFIVLNTEMNDGRIHSEQLDFLKKALSEQEVAGIKNVFIFSHRPIWSENVPAYEGVFLGNTRTAFGKNNFSTEIEPLLKKIAKEKSVYWMSGSIASAPVSFFYHQDTSSNICFIQTAIRDLPRDAILQVVVKNGKIAFNGISLTGQNLQPIEEYNLDFWKKNSRVEASFNYRLVPYLAMKMIFHYYFWIGLVFSLILFFCLSFLFKKWKRKE